MIDDECEDTCKCYICGDYELFEHGVILKGSSDFICCGCIEAEGQGELPKEISELARKIHDGWVEMTGENRRILTEAINGD